MLEDLRCDPQAAAFNMPVNWQALNIPDYPLIVKKPMDLQTLEHKVNGQHVFEDGTLCPAYELVQEFIDDLNLIWSNCKLFNQISSLIYRNAQAMSRTSNRLLYKYKVVVREPSQAGLELDELAREFNKEPPKAEGDEEGNGDSSDEFGVFDPSRHVSFDEKIRFSEQLKKCKRGKLTRIVEVLQKEQQDSVEDLGEEKLQLRLDQIELDAYLKCQQILDEPDEDE